MKISITRRNSLLALSLAIALFILILTFGGVDNLVYDLRNLDLKKEKPSILCLNDTDNGLDPENPGMVTYVYTQDGYWGTASDFCHRIIERENQTLPQYADECEGENCFQTEYYCNGTTLEKAPDKPCPKGCKDGACVN